MIKKIRDEILKFHKLPHVDKKIVNAFLSRLSIDSQITKEENSTDHLCSFFVPVYLPTLEIFVGHHIKAKEWIPPGGHMEKKEAPQDAVYREFEEELRRKLKKERVELFDIGITKIAKSVVRPCQIHWDFWHYVIVDKENFDYDKGEFYHAEWLTIDSAVKKAHREEIISHLLKLKKLLKMIKNR